MRASPPYSPAEPAPPSTPTAPISRTTSTSSFGSGGPQRALEAALAGIGFRRDGDRFVHSGTRFFVEFPRGPLAIGDDVDVKPVVLKVARGRTLALSATDACRDRLAAFYHWSDRQSLQSAVEIAKRHRVNMAAVRRWSEREGHLDKFEEFRAALRAVRQHVAGGLSTRRTESAG